MVIHSEGQFDPAFSDVEQAGQMLNTMEGILAERKGLPVTKIRPALARRIKITVGTIVNIKKQRRKSIPSLMMRAIRQELIAVLQNEVMRLENEIQIHRQIAGGHRSDVLEQAETQVIAARKTLRLAAL